MPLQAPIDVLNWRWVQALRAMFSTRRAEPVQQAERIVRMQLHIVLPAKAGVIAVVLYYLFWSGWFYGAQTTRTVVLETIRSYFLVYVGCNAVAWAVFWLWQRFPPGLFQWLVFTLGLLDGLFIGGLVLITGGFESIAFWVFPGLIVLNAWSIPLAVPQIVLNLFLSVFFASAGFLNSEIPEGKIALLSVPGRSTPRPSLETPAPESTNRDQAGHSEQPVPREHKPWRLDDPTLETQAPTTPEGILLRLFLLWLLTACCYGVQVLAERERRAREEAAEFAMREGQLHSAGRLAAEFAHQIKNPLAIINNALYSLKRGLKEGRQDIQRQIAIIEEEVNRSDNIVTQLLGYAQLNEGRVERLDLAEELDRAIRESLPAAACRGIQVQHHYGSDFPPLLMQRQHLSQILVNLLTNAREAVDGNGRVIVSAERHPDDSIEISIQDNGPGIPPDKLERIFEAYYTTKEKGTGLGLAIVKHNVELYGGTVRVESGLGKGARFALVFPARIAVRPAAHK